MNILVSNVNSLLPVFSHQLKVKLKQLISVASLCGTNVHVAECSDFSLHEGSALTNNFA